MLHCSCANSRDEELRELVCESTKSLTIFIYRKQLKKEIKTEKLKFC